MGNLSSHYIEADSDLTHCDRDKNGRHFADDIFNSIFIPQSKICYVLIQIRYIAIIQNSH